VLSVLSIAKAPVEQILELQKIRREVDPKETGMTPRNRARLRQFDDPENLRRLVDLPQAIVRALPRQGAAQLRPRGARPVRTRNCHSDDRANADEEPCLAPPRPTYVAQIRPGGVRHIVIPVEEVKNRTPLAFELSDTLGRVMDVYLARCRSLLSGDPERFLFPARKGGAKTPGQLAVQIRRVLRQETGIDLNAHAFRHLAALLFLREFPGEYETTRLLLGHENLNTTTQYYCGLEQADALRRFDALVIAIARGSPHDPQISCRRLACPRSRTWERRRRAWGPV
jgi:hypothetical protein